MTHYIATIAILGVFAVMAFAAERVDRYKRLADHADQGVGADEYGGPRRFTRPTDREGCSANATPGQQKAPNTAAKHAFEAINQPHQEENRS